MLMPNEVMSNWCSDEKQSVKMTRTYNRCEQIVSGRRDGVGCCVGKCRQLNLETGEGYPPTLPLAARFRITLPSEVGGEWRKQSKQPSKFI